MSVQADPYYNHLDDPQSVTLSATRGGTESTDEITKASRLSNRVARNNFGGVALEADEQTWNIPDALLSNIADLRPGDKLTHGSDVWRITDISQDALKTQWILRCTKERS